MSRVAVRAEGLGKRFLVLRSRRTALRALRAWLRGESLRRELWALRDLSFEVPRGAKLALVGRNGSGKTTLLRVLSGISPPTCGRLLVSQPPRPLFHCSIGLGQELSVVENVFLFGSVHGVSRRRLAARLQAIVARAGLGDLAHVPVKDLSMGQVQRLALSIFAESDAEFLVFDEVIGHVDREFLAEADRFFRDLARSSRTLILTSHDTDFLGRYCDQALWLDGGRLRRQGPFDRVVREYERAFGAEPAPAAGSGPARASGG